MLLTRFTPFVLAGAALAVGAPGLLGWSQAADGIGLAGYRLKQGPVRIAGLRDNASGLAYGPESKTLFLAVNSPPLVVELRLDGRPLRWIQMKGFDDLEGIAHWKENWFAVVEERRYTLCLVGIGEQTDTVQYDETPRYRLETRTGDNNGLEGVAIDAAKNRFFCVKEKRPRRIYEFPAPTSRDARLQIEHPWSIDGEEQGGLDDLSGLHFHRQTGHLLLLSHESAAVLELSPEGRVVGRLSLKAGSAGLLAGIPKAEGITMDDEDRLYLCSEPNLYYVFSK